ncbi:MAG: hypothetical protein OIN66_09690 [Candidatus Methanoperedens sp.]|nr:hypothetical protein [Candidatus Methanoperedens sp.]
MAPGMDPLLKDWFQVLFWAVAVIGGVVAGFKAIYELHESTQQRVAELRWKQANAARDILSEIHHHTLAANAVVMLDWYEGMHDYKIEEGNKVVISYNDVISALRKTQLDNLEEKDIYIRDCLDWFFYFIDRIEHYIRTGFISFQDVDTVFEPYAKKIMNQIKIYDDFMASHDYELARKFWRRYEPMLTTRS